ncbi:MAG: hypothetical protein UW43_C0002G0011 [Candidatus Yanofskybacteria bacterium GW2011_GWA1_44_21]|uniref:NAD-dependent epimerase/dehydratase domain-containing protein n=2 Tax=Parcubacteria group TaxID=1794811 RepID=A0A1F8H0L4_9BACT|nr:MAG: hypothetical protein UU38_C0004G0077 [Candidatus Wolfebacteria bacterium GW2011_GWB1_41_12]KKT28357.1 MAG: hypothetical protein UW14_C0009G0009 [Candidatus Yanofskybacteria bacterium GW2011_GWA2_44_10]KKT50727.1 MAG: hypothetical protein UW43_C0002G0011 [Candidatus Yanofskybacteria bacterium GW2011_GWA1_44_21]OGN03505.1 MAG: hypothetical protein A2657_02370 [Candidatus Yanofskybacteria bacterium RIFCSPHIGHO2_01_FULL_44_110b]OGN14195.1 MAG: hypothetical protein A3C01_01195 [Candidatus Ya
MINPKIVIFGGNGFISSWLINLLKSDHGDIVTFDIHKKFSDYDPKRTAKVMNFRKKLLADVRQVKGDVRDPKQVERFINKEKPDIIVFLASIPFANYPDKFEQFSVEASGIVNVLKANEKFNARIVYMSSLFAMGHFDHAATEIMHLDPSSHYGIGKAASEYLIKSFSNNYGIIRTTSVYGAGDFNNRVPQIIIENALTGKGNLKINEAALLDFTYVKDLAEGIKKLMFHDGNGIFNISGGRAMTLIDFINAVEASTGKKLKYKTHSVSDRQRRGTLVNDKARLVLGWEPKFDLKAGVADTISIYKESIKI